MDFNATLQTIKSLASDPVGYWNTHKVGSRPFVSTYVNFLIPLAVVGIIADIVSKCIYGVSIPLAGTVHYEFFPTLFSSILMAIISLAGVFVTGLVMEKVAPKFGGSISRDGAIEFVTLAGLLAMLSRVAVIIPFFGWLASLIMLAAGIYCIYIFWVGILSQTGVTEAQRPKFLAVVIVIMFVFNLIAYSAAAPSLSTGNFSLDNKYGTVTSEDLDNATKQMQKMMGNIGEK